jgi:hypothetical protein
MSATSDLGPRGAGLNWLRATHDAAAVGLCLTHEVALGVSAPDPAPATVRTAASAPHRHDELKPEARRLRTAGPHA